MRAVVEFLARGVAIVGGVVLVLIVAMTCISVTGREIGLGEITGNYEILEAGIAFAIFSFFPICQLYGGHATVDVFTSGLRGRGLYALRAFWEVLLSAAILFLTAQLYGGLERYLNNGQTTLFLEFPVWWSYAASFAASVVASIVAVYCAVVRVTEAVRGREELPVDT